LTKGASGREGEEEEEGRLAIDRGVRSTEEDTLSPKLVGPACLKTHVILPSMYGYDHFSIL
jgi:hypothetical protein